MARFALALLVAATSVACGGSTSESGSSGGSAGSGATGAAGSGGSGATGAVGGTGGGSGGGIGGGGAGGAAGGINCGGFEDQPSPNQVTLRIENKTQAPIYVGGGNGCGPSPLYGLQGPSGEVPLIPSGCGYTCEDLQQHGDICPDACMIPPVFMITPGGHLDAPWSGLTYRQETMPAACYFESQYAPPTCQREVVAEKGTYGVIASAATELLCNFAGQCTCTPDTSGSCQIDYGGSPSGALLAAKASFEWPSASLVLVTFQ
ncbi:MAG: hypothetical protein R3B13_08815 [Polyangiaceae bacterium]